MKHFTEDDIMKAIPEDKRKAVDKIFFEGGEGENNEGLWWIWLKDGWYDFEPSGCTSSNWKEVEDPANRCSTSFNIDVAYGIRSMRKNVASEFDYIHEVR